MHGLQKRVPTLFIQNAGEDSTKIALTLTRARRKFAVRLTGGCGLMSAEDAEGLNALFVDAFEGFDGAFLFGGTRMLNRNDPRIIVPGITEVGVAIRAHCPNACFLGVVPRTCDLRLSEHGMVVADDLADPYFTIVHPDQDACVVVQEGVDKEATWDTEYQECFRIIDNLRTYAAWESVHVSYNGGGVTNREIRAAAASQLPVLLIAGSGRTTDALAEDESFLASHPTVRVADKRVPRDHPRSLRSVVREMGVVPAPLRIFHPSAQTGA